MKRILTQEDITFLKRLQKKMNTQDTYGQAEPRFWVIKGHEKRYEVEDGYEDGFELFDQDSSEILADGYEESIEYIESNIFTEINRIYKRGLRFKECENPDSIIVDDDSDWYRGFKEENDNEEFYGSFHEFIAYLNSEFSYHLILINYVNEDKIYENTFFMTGEAAWRHLKANHYHYDKTAHPYAMTAWRNPEAYRLWNILREVDFDLIESRTPEKIYLPEFIENKTEYDGFDLFDADMTRIIASGPNGTFAFLNSLVVRGLNDAIPGQEMSLTMDKGHLIFSKKDEEPQKYTFEEFLEFLKTISDDYDYKLCHYIYKKNDEKPWHSENWYDADIINIMKEKGIAVSDENLAAAKEAVTGIFDDLSSRQELLGQWIENEFMFEADELCPFCNQETRMNRMVQRCENCGELILCCSMCDNHSDCHQCEFESLREEMQKKDSEKVRFVSVWDGGSRIETEAAVDKIIRKVFHIAKSDADESLDILENEFIIFADGKEAPVYTKMEYDALSKEEKEKAYWYE